MNTSKIVIALIAIALIIGFGTFFYITRPVPAPSEDIRLGTELSTEEDSSTSLFRISQEDSRVEFNINEVLRDEDFTAVGVTNQVAGDIRVNFEDFSQSEVGNIRVNARTLKTDSERRDGAIGSLILRSEEFEFIEFKPTSISGLPQGNSAKTPINFNIIGDLTITNITHPATFNAIITTVSEESISGEATAIINRSDYNLTIPDVPFVANVEDEVTLKINFVANRASS